MESCRTSLPIVQNVTPARAPYRVAWGAVIVLSILLAPPGVGAVASKAATAKFAPEHRYPVGVQYLRWHDQERNRTVPCKIYSPESDDEMLPVIVFSHGLGGSRDSCAYLGRHWASRGYVSVHLQHLGSDETLWRGKPFGRAALREAYQRPSTGYQRPRDVSFVLDQLEQMHESKSSLGAKLDLARVGVAGYDFGAQAGLLLAGQKSQYAYRDLADSRVQAVVAMSPPVLPARYTHEQRFGTVHVPCMHITGTQDDGIIGSTRAHQRRIPFDHIDRADQFLVTLRGGDHMVYHGHIRQRNRQSDGYYQRLIRDAATLFFDAYLKDDARARSELARDEGAELLAGGAQCEAKLAPESLVSASGS